MKKYIKFFLFLAVYSIPIITFAASPVNSDPQKSFSNESKVFVQENSDPYEEIYQLAKSFEEQEEYITAGTEFKRYIFLQDYAKGIHQYESFISLANCYEHLDNIDLALTYIQNAINLQYENPQDFLIDEKDSANLIHIRLLAKKAKKNNQSLEADFRFASYLFMEGHSTKVKMFASLEHLQNLVDQKNWTELSRWFAAYNELYPSLFDKDQQDDFSYAIEQIGRFKPKKPILAAHLSFIPGLGQLYAHEYKEAANAFILNSSLIGVSIFSLINANIWDFSLLEFNPLFRFYRGNILNAQKYTYKYNNTKTNELSQPLSRIINQAKENLIGKF